MSKRFSKIALGLMIAGLVLMFTPAAWAADGTKPENTPGKDFYDTGVALVTDAPAEGVESLSVEEGMNLCWG